MDGSQQRDLASAAKMGKKDIGVANGGADRGGKAKKRGGTSNRGGGKGDNKPGHK